MPAKSRKPAASAATRRPATKRAAKPPAKEAAGNVQRRLWLTYPPKRIKAPVIWELGHRFELSTNIRQASVTEEIGLVSLELDGEREDIKRAIAWLEELGIKVEPVEINTIEG